MKFFWRPQHGANSRRGRSRGARSRGRRRGISLLLFVATLPIICGTCGLVIDVGQLQARRAQAQRAADAAALAGAYMSGLDNSRVEPKSDEYAALNGFSSARGDIISVSTYYQSNTLQNAAPTNTVKVAVAHQERVYFAPICEALLSFMGWSEGAATFSRQVTARAVARKYVYLPMSTGGNYGIASGSQSVVNNIINGPYSAYDDADPYSGKYLLTGEPNPRYAQFNGYQNFTFHVSDQFKKNSSDSKVYLQIFDPDSGNTDFNTVNLRQTPKFPNGVAPPPTGPAVTTFEVFKKNANGTLSPIPGASKSYYGGSDPANDMQWVTPDNFGIDLNTFASETGDYAVRVSTSAGNGSNSYALRAGPAEGLSLDQVTWNDRYGDKLGTDPSNIAVPMNADGRLLIGFQTNGTATLKLGYLGKEFAGKTVQVAHFDLDIGATSLSYSIDSLPNWSSPGFLPQNYLDGARPTPGNGIWHTDSIPIPIDFQGGNLAAKYTAGVVANLGKDGSAWELFGEGTGNGFVRLVE